MKKLDSKLYKMKVLSGKEELAKEWLNFLKEHSESAPETLKQEKIYLESYFTLVEDGEMYIYLFIVGDDIEYANKIAGESKNPIDLKHFEYMQSCVDFPDSKTIDCFCNIQNL